MRVFVCVLGIVCIFRSLSLLDRRLIGLIGVSERSLKVKLSMKQQLLNSALCVFARVCVCVWQHVFLAPVHIKLGIVDLNTVWWLYGSPDWVVRANWRGQFFSLEKIAAYALFMCPCKLEGICLSSIKIIIK